jgi:hypothetical protein
VREFADHVRRASGEEPSAPDGRAPNVSLREVFNHLWFLDFRTQGRSFASPPSKDHTGSVRSTKERSLGDEHCAEAPTEIRGARIGAFS